VATQERERGALGRSAHRETRELRWCNTVHSLMAARWCRSDGGVDQMQGEALYRCACMRAKRGYVAVSTWCSSGAGIATGASAAVEQGRPVASGGMGWTRRCMSLRTLVSGGDAAQRRPRCEEVVPSGSSAGGPCTHDGMTRCHGGARVAGGRRCCAVSLVS
jgi:hypothetical protein